MKKIILFMLIVLLSFAGLEACSSDQKPDKAENENGETVVDSNSQKATAFPIIVTDALDQKVTIEKKPERIVSLIPSNTEITFALGLNKEIVGVSEFDNYPEEALEKEKIGGMEINLEKIISLQPDLVLAHESTAVSFKDSLDQLKNSGITIVYVNDSSSFEDVYRSIELIGKVTGTTEKAESLVTSMKEELEQIKELAAAIPEEAKKSVFVEVGAEPEIYTTGSHTFMNEMIEAINATNIASDLEGWQPMTEEAIIAKNPEVIITTYGFYTENAVELVLSREGWDGVTAIKEKQVFDVHSDLVTRSGPRLIDGVKELAKAVYPDVFKEK